MSLRNQYAYCASWAFAASFLLFVPMAMAQSEGQQWSPPNRAVQYRVAQRTAEPRRFEASLSTLSNERSEKGPFAILIRNADTDDGKPPFALVDQYGEIQRYIEPSSGIDLAAHVGSRIRVKHDTGETLLASQLELPNEMQPLLRTQQRKRPQANRNLRQQVDGHLGVVATQFDADTGSATSDRITPLGDSPLGDSAEPIVLEDLLRDEANSLPAPSRSRSTETLEPIAGEEILPYGGDYQPSHHTHGPDCPHCNKQHSTPPAQVGSTRCNCTRCRAKRSFSLRKLGSGTLNLGSSSCGCDSCRAGGVGFATNQFDAELLLFAVNDSEAEIGDTQDDLEAGFRLTYSRVNAQDQIFRLRYFNFNSTLRGNNNRHEMEEFDMEIGHRFYLGGLNGEFTAGIRWASFEERFGLDYDSTFGPLVGLQLRGRKILGATSFVNLRHSWQFGEASDRSVTFGSSDAPGTFSIAEAQLGLEWNRCTRFGDVVLRTMFETQYWSGVQEIDTEDIGLIGWTNSIGFAF